MSTDTKTLRVTCPNCGSDHVYHFRYDRDWGYGGDYLPINASIPAVERPDIDCLYCHDCLAAFDGPAYDKNGNRIDYLGRLTARLAEVEADLERIQKARKEAESEANANEEELAVVEELLYQSRQRIEQLEEQLDMARISTHSSTLREVLSLCKEDPALLEHFRPLLKELYDALAQSQKAEKAKGESSEAMCPTMGRPRKECGCPDCGSSLIDFPSRD